MTKRSALVLSTIAVLVGWVSAVVILAVIDLVRGCEIPSQNRLDCVSIDFFLLVIKAPIPCLLFLLLWPFCMFVPRTALWQAPIWTVVGFCAGYAASWCFFYVICWLRPVFPLPLFTLGTIAGTIGFTFAFALRYGGVRHLTMRWSQRLTGEKIHFDDLTN